MTGGLGGREAEVAVVAGVPAGAPDLGGDVPARWLSDGDPVEVRVNGERLAQARLARSFRSRVRGLLGTRSLGAGEGLLIVPCRAVHMRGMSYPLDVVFANASGRVVRVLRGLRPGRRFVPPVLAANFALELPSGAAAHVQLGDTLELDPWPLGSPEVFAVGDGGHVWLGLMAALVGLSALVTDGVPLGAALAPAVLLWYLVAVSGTDLSRRTIPEALTVSAFALWLGAALLTRAPVGSALLFSTVMTLPFLVVSLRWPGQIGGADVLMVFLLVLGLGPFGGLVALGVSVLTSSGYAVVRALVRRGRMNDPMPAAPWFLLGLVVELLVFGVNAGPALVAWR